MEKTGQILPVEPISHPEVLKISECFFGGGKFGAPGGGLFGSLESGQPPVVLLTRKIGGSLTLISGTHFIMFFL